MAAVLDTLIQMNVAVPADTLRTLAPDFGNDVAILVSRMPSEESTQLSFDFYRSPPERAFSLQYVSAALLALHPPAGFAADLLAGISVNATVFVVLPGSDQLGSGFGGSCGEGIHLPREDWPLTGQYALSKQKSDGASLVVAGVDPIYAVREESTRYLQDNCSMSMGVYLGPDDRLCLIAEMLGVSPEEIQWQTSVSRTIEFQSLEQFDSALLAFVGEQQQEYRETITALTDHNLLSSADAQQSLPELNLNIRDKRGDGALPIPKPSNLPLRVEWSYAIW
jgi:hypothetical protein